MMMTVVKTFLQMGWEIIQSNWHIVKVSHGTEKLSNEIELEKRGEKAGIY